MMMIVVHYGAINWSKMKNWQLILTVTLCGGVFTCTLGGPNLLTPTISFTIGTLALIGLVSGRTSKKENS